MSKRNRNNGATMSTETQESQEVQEAQETQEQAQPVEVTVEAPAEAQQEEQPQEAPVASEPAPTIAQDAVVETPAIEKKPEDVAKKIAISESTKTAARIAQKPTSGASNIASLQSTNPRVRQFAFQVNQYLALCKQPSTTEAAMVKKLDQFTHIIRVIINSTDPAVYAEAYQFFKNHRNNILREDLVFQYVHTLPTELSIRAQTIYTTFMELVAANVDKKPFRLDYGLIRDNMKLPAQHPLLNWIRNRLSK